MFKHAVILAGGLGTRLKPYTTVLPKPLVPVGERPILEIIISQLAKSGFKKVTIAINHKGNLIKAFFGDGSQWNIDIDYSMEKRPLGTMGPLNLIGDLPDNFLVMNGDVLTDLDFDCLYHFHLNNESLFTIASCQREEKSEFGVLDVREGQLVGFREKPIMQYMVSMGIYMVNKRILQFIPSEVLFGFDHLMMKLIGLNEHVLTYHHQGLWLDIGRPQDCLEANERLYGIEGEWLK
ncbi:MAG: sugar phosphate nucleotidyltransferase [Parachlamydiaceae bacterium]